MTRLPKLTRLLTGTAFFTSLMLSAANAETIFDAMAAAYNNNATLNATRAGARATDEAVPIAKSAMRPQISADLGVSASSSDRDNELRIGKFGVQIDQTIFDGFQTKNNVLSAEARVRASQNDLENDTQNTLFDAASAYMDVVRDRQIAGLRAKSIAFLDEQVRAAKARFQVGEGTRTDVAQAEAQRAAAVAQATNAKARVKSSEAVYQQVTGSAPGKLQPAKPAGKSMPKSIASAYAIAESNHPAVEATKATVDSFGFALKATEGKLLPTLSARARLESSASNSTIVPGFFGNTGGYSEENSASVSAQLNIPIYQGGLVAAQVRQSKEKLSQARIQVDATVDRVRAAVASSWASYEGAKAILAASGEEIDAAKIALSGLVAERDVGQRTTLDVLNGQNALVTAQINAVTAQRDLVVASYAVLSATGSLTPARIGLNVKGYDPEVNYQAVKDKWFGLRTVDGR
jgi:outer membrane protein